MGVKATYWKAYCATIEKTLRTLAWNDIRCKNHEKFYDAVKMISQEIIELAELSREHERRNLPDDCVIAVDGSGNHRRRGTNCLFSVICRQNGKVIESITVSNKIIKDDPTFCKHSKLMEAHGLRMGIERLRNFPQITGYVHDTMAQQRTK